jgi:hypothetical protein
MGCGKLRRGNGFVNRSDITPQILRELLLYDSESGDLMWKPREVKWFRKTPFRDASHSMAIWNSRYAMKPAFTAKDSHGYSAGSVFGVMFRAHRVGFAITYGRWPKFEIDHKDGDCSNNSLCNLREATFSQNRANRDGLHKTSKFKGVHRPARRRAYSATIKVDGIMKQLGSFSSEVAAARAYDVAAQEYFGEFARLNFPNGVSNDHH